MPDGLVTITASIEHDLILDGKVEGSHVASRLKEVDDIITATPKEAGDWVTRKVSDSVLNALKTGRYVDNPDQVLSTLLWLACDSEPLIAETLRHGGMTIACNYYLDKEPYALAISIGLSAPMLH